MSCSSSEIEEKLVRNSYGPIGQVFHLRISPMCGERVGLILLGSTHVSVIGSEGTLHGKNTQITDVTFGELV